MIEISVFHKVLRGTGQRCGGRPLWELYYSISKILDFYVFGSNRFAYLEVRTYRSQGLPNTVYGTHKRPMVKDMDVGFNEARTEVFVSSELVF